MDDKLQKTLNQLLQPTPAHVVYDVCQTRSFATTAERLNVTQACVTFRFERAMQTLTASGAGGLVDEICAWLPGFSLVEGDPSED